MEKPMPVPDRYSAFFWEHAAEGKLSIQGFEGSEYVQYPPNAVAETPDVDGPPIPVVVAGTGVLFAYTVLHQAFHPAWADSLPYVIGLTDLSDHPGIRILTNIVEVDHTKLRSGMPMEVTFEDRGTMRLPQFRPVEAGDRS